MTFGARGVALAATYVGTIEAAFSALMRLSLRLTVERNGRAAGLGPYLEDPVLLFVPVRLLLGLIIAITAIIFATLTGVDDLKDPGSCCCCQWRASSSSSSTCCRLLIVRRDPEQVLVRLLPTFKLSSKMRCVHHPQPGRPHSRRCAGAPHRREPVGRRRTARTTRARRRMRTSKPVSRRA